MKGTPFIPNTPNLAGDVAAEATARATADALLAPLANPSFTGVATAPAVKVTGKNGLSARTFSGRSTTTGAPTTGTWAVDDVIRDSAGQDWRCTVAGTPGTWVLDSSTSGVVSVVYDGAWPATRPTATTVVAIGGTADPSWLTSADFRVATGGDIALGIYGDGSDGDVTISGTTTLARDMFYDTLTIASGGILATAGYRVYARTLIDNQSGGTIRNNGNAGAANGTAGAGQVGLTLGQTGAGGAGGTAAGTAGTSVTALSLGGASGAGGTGSGGAGGAAGTVTAPTAAMGSFRALPFATTGMLLHSAGTGAARGGAGGGGGGGDGSAGGGGAAGGGVVLLVAPEIRNNGVIEAKGGAGGTPATGNRGGGGGGGGGALLLVTAARTGSGSTSVAGGTGGTKSGTGTNGADGSVGTIYNLTFG